MASTEEENVPRRLRRFLRKGESIPEQYATEENPSVTEKKFSEKIPSTEPIPPHSSRERRRKREESAPTEKQGLLGKITSAFSPSPSPANKALGLEEKNAETNYKEKDELQKTLDELKKLKESVPEKELENMSQNIAEQSQQKEPPKIQESKTSIHFTPAGSAPNPVDPNALPPTLPISTQTPLNKGNLSPRERAQLRAQQRAQQRSNPTLTPTQPQSLSAPALTQRGSHYRRRMGQLTSGGSATEKEEMGINESEMEKEDTNVKDLFGDLEKQKKKKKNVGEEEASEEEELDEESDMKLFEEDEEK